MPENYAKLEGVAEILGHEVDLSRIENPALMRSIKSRLISRNYKETYSEHHKQHSDYRDTRPYSDHREHQQYTDCASIW